MAARRGRVLGWLLLACTLIATLLLAARLHPTGWPESVEHVRLYAKAVVDGATAWADRGLRGEAAERELAARWEPVQSVLHDLELNVIPIGPRPVRAGAMAQLDAGLLLTVTAHGSFDTVDSRTAAVRSARIASPLNLDAMRASPSWSVPGFDPDYFRVHDVLAVSEAPNRYILFATHYWYTPTCIEFRLSRTEIELRGGELQQASEWMPMFTATPCFPVLKSGSPTYPAFSGHLAGGRMLDFDADHLLLTVGDQQVFEARGVDVSQDPSATMGKILLVDKRNGRASVYASGSRNAQGLLRDRAGRLWSTEHGPYGGDELNLLKPGANLGWPLVTYGMNYDLRPWPGAAVEGRHDRFQKPVFAWVPSIGITGLVEAPGDAFPNWKGDLLVGSLIANTLFRVRVEDDVVRYVEPIRLSGHGIRDITVLPDGRIAILDNRYSVLFLRNGAGHGQSRRYDPAGTQSPTLAGLTGARAEVAQRGALLFGRRCAECHSLGNEASVGPALHDVVGRPIGAVPGFAYSSALASHGGVWGETSLARFIAEPESLGKVAMPNLGLDTGDAQAIAVYLAEIARQGVRPVAADSGPRLAAHAAASAPAPR